MVDVRRAYRRWFWRRMSWLLPGLCVAVIVAARLSASQGLELWLRVPALAISGGVALLFIGLALLPVRVLRAKSRGDGRRAQSLRREFRSYPQLALIALGVSLILLAVPLFFAPSLAVSSRTPVAAGPRSHGRPAAAPVVARAPEPPAPPILAEPVSAPAPEPPPPAPAEAQAAETPLPPALTPAAPVPVELPSGQELFSLRFRPDGEDGSFSISSTRAVSRLDRPGLPGEDDLGERQAPEFQLDVTILPRSGGWYGAIYEGAIDLPFGRDDSFRTELFLGSFSDKKGNYELEASLEWQRATLEVEHRLAGYTRHATFDLALRVGVSLDRMITHDGAISVDSSLRPSPWIGVETALWEQDGLGLVVQAGHSFALRLNGAAMSSTDLRVEIRIDLTETISIEIGWRYTALRIHDRGSSGGLAYQELDQSFSGPIGGFNVRF